MIGQIMAAIRELTLEVYAALPKGHPGPSMDFATDLPTPTLSKAQRELLDQVRRWELRVLGVVVGACIGRIKL